MICNLCPRKCNAQREEFSGNGFCKMGKSPKIAKVMRHYWEEPCISGTNGSGAVFFSGCSLRCCYCQNYEISTLGKGKYITEEKLSEIFIRLKEEGAHNINLVNPTHFTDSIKNALKIKPGIPVVYNCGGYETTETLETLKNEVNVFLADFKYAESFLAGELSCAPDYPEVTMKALKKMYDIVGDFELDENGIMQKGLIIRHLVLPGKMENSKKVIDFVAKEFKNKKVMFSLMGQYVPMGEVPGNEKYKDIDKKVSVAMYKKLCEYMENCGIEYGYTQALSSAESFYTPEFDCDF